jgi:rhodanese-related sulfurtransferase
MTRVVRDYLAGKISFVNMLAPAQLNESILFNEDTFILDVRPPVNRKEAKGLPNAHEVDPLRVENYLKQIPRDKQIVVYCPGGGLSVMVSYFLKAKGYKRVTNLRGGLDAWIKRRNDLYEKYAGQNITVLKSDMGDS